jgi:hypothetical protein
MARNIPNFDEAALEGQDGIKQKSQHRQKRRRNEPYRQQTKEALAFGAQAFFRDDRWCKFTDEGLHSHFDATAIQIGIADGALGYQAHPDIVGVLATLDIE